MLWCVAHPHLPSALFCLAHQGPPDGSIGILPTTPWGPHIPSWTREKLLSGVPPPGLELPTGPTQNFSVPPPLILQSFTSPCPECTTYQPIPPCPELWHLQMYSTFLLAGQGVLKTISIGVPSSGAVASPWVDAVCSPAPLSSPTPWLRSM